MDNGQPFFMFFFMLVTTVNDMLCILCFFLQLSQLSDVFKDRLTIGLVIGKLLVNQWSIG